MTEFWGQSGHGVGKGGWVTPATRARTCERGELPMWLLMHPDQEYGLSDLAARMGVALSTSHREVVRLDRAGLIASRTLGRNRLAWANTDHPAAVALVRLLEVTFGPRVVMGAEFGISGIDGW